MADKYVTHNAVGGGDGTTVGTAWTLAEALTTYTRNSPNYDRLLICNTGTYTYPYGLPATQMNFSATGTDGNPLLVWGADAYGVPYDLGSSNHVTFDASADTGMTAANSIFNVTTVNECIEFHNIYFKSSKAHGVNLNAVSNLFFHDCRFGYNVSTGIYATVSNATAEFHRCEFDHNNYGVSISGNGRGRFRFYDCSIHHNAVYGIYDSVGENVAIRTAIFRSLIYRNGNSGITINGATGFGGLILFDSVIYANAGHGLYNNGQDVGEWMVENCIFAGHSGMGFYAIYDSSVVSRPSKWLMKNCVAYGNTGVMYLNSGGAQDFPGVGHAYIDPQFVNTTDGSEDFRVQNMDLARQMVMPTGGTSNYLIGALQSLSIGSGGGRPGIVSGLIRGID